MPRSRLIEGRIAYRVSESGRTREFGRELFSISVQSSGHRTMRAVCEFDDEGITRDVTYTVNAEFRPMDCYVRVALADRVVGAGWFLFGDDFAEGEAMTAAEGRIRQRIAVPERVTAFGSHPICSDIWRLAHLKRIGVGQPQRLSNCMNSSPLSHGESGPMLFRREYTYLYRGAERVNVGAGQFDCHRFDWPVRAGKTLCMWTCGDDLLPVRMAFPEGGKTYELETLSIREG
ncbi:MAG: hypothetical protein SFV21_11620 [Rhodospirillaceae bacterium]|nr:hypothetical protein [Rhodospirillaceae bacterium]